MMQQKTRDKTRRKTWGFYPWVLLLVAAWGTLGATQRAEAAYTATSQSATAATLTGDATADTLTITSNGTNLLWNGSTNFGGGATLPANATSTLTISLGGTGTGAHTIILGTPASPASTLKAKIIMTATSSSSTLTVDDSGSNTANTISSNTSFVGPLATHGILGTGINVDDISSFAGGVFIKTGTAVDTVTVVSSSAGEAISLDSGGGLDNVTIGNAGSVQNIAAPVTVNNSPSRTNLTVDDSADATPRTATLNNTAITGLAPAAINYGTNDILGLTLKGGSGGNTFTVNNTIGNSANPVTTLNSGTNIDTVNVLATATNSSLTVNGQNNADNVTVGNAGSVQAIAGAVTVSNAFAFTKLTVDDSADTTARMVNLSSTAITGLAPAAINYATTDINNLTVNGGTGGNTCTVNNTISNTAPNAATTLNSGTGADTVNVLATASNSSLNVNGQNGNDAVTIGNAGSVQAIAGVISLTNNLFFTALTVDDSADATARTATISIIAISSLAPAAINYAPSDIGSLTVKGGSGGNTFTVNNTIAHTSPVVTTTLNSGTGADTINVLATNSNSILNVNGQNGADNLTLGNAGSVQAILGAVNITNNFDYTNLTVDDSADGTARTATLSNTSISGLAPAPINFGSIDLRSWTVNGGTGGNTFTINSSPGVQLSTLNSGVGNDVVNVLATQSTVGLNVNGQSGSDAVVVGNAGSAQGITAAVNVGNVGGATSLTVDDSADATARSVAVSGTQLTGLIPGTITPGTGVTTFLIKSGTANDSFTVTPATGPSLTLDGGAGTDAINFNLSGVTAPQFTATGVGAGKVTSSNSQLVTYANFEAVTPVNQPPFNTTPAAALSTPENTPLTLASATSNAISVGDPDAGNNPLNVSLSVTGGTLSLNPAAVAGLTFSSGNGTNNASLIFTGTIANINAALNGLVFTPTSLFSGSALLSLITNDLGNVGTGGALSASTTLPITVIPAPRSLSIVSSVAQNEGNSGITNMAFTVTLTPVSGQTVTVSYATADGTALAGADYAATSGTLTFAPGQTTQTINVPILGDTLNEPDETFTVTLGSATNATVAVSGAVSTGTIFNDDAVPGLSINDVQLPLAAMGSTPFAFTVTLNAASSQTVTVNYTTVPGTATAGVDYTTTSGTLTFAPGVTSQTISVPGLAQTVSKAPTTFTVTLSGATGATITRPTGTGTIVNTTTPALALTVTPSTFSQSAGESVAVGTVSRNTADTSKPLVVTLTSSNPLRATPAVKTVTIPVGAASTQFVIDAIADTLAGGATGVTITATAPGLTTATALLTITSPNIPALNLTVIPMRVLETAGATAAIGKVTRNTPTTAALKVTLTSSNPAKATVPASVTILANATAATFPIRVFHKTTADGPQRITVTATATGLALATASLTVLDSESKLTASGRVTTSIAADAGTTGLNGGTNLSGPAGTPAKPLLVGVPGSVVSLLSGAVLRDVIVTDATGNYSFTNLPAGSYKISVQRPGYTFSPLSRPVTLVATNVIGLDFSGTVKTSLSGRVINRLADGSRKGVAGITVVARSGHGAFTARTDAKGHYAFTALALDAYVVLPVVKGTFFAPAMQTLLLTAANPTLVAADFVQGGSDKTAPTAKVTAPLAGTYKVAQQPIRAAGSAQDIGGAGLAYVTVALLRYPSATATSATGYLNFNNGLFSASASSLTEKLAAGTTAWSLRGLPTLPAGFYGVRATVTDAANNVGVSPVVRFTITAPMIPIAKTATPNSTVALSATTADVATGSVNLRFFGALDAETASDATNYSVTVNGHSETVESAGYNASTHTVSLGLAEGALHSGDTVVVSWNGLQDGAGNSLAAQRQSMTVR